MNEMEMKVFEKTLEFAKNGWEISREYEGDIIYVHALSGKAEMYIGSYHKEVEEAKSK